MVKDIIKEQMEYNNVSQSDLVLKTGIDQKGLSDILNGKRSLTIDLSTKLGRAFGIPDDLLYKLQERKKTLHQMRKDKEIIEMADYLNTFKKYELMSSGTQLKTASDFIRAASFSSFKTYIDSRIIGMKSYKEKTMAYFWMALMENKYGKKISDKPFSRDSGNKVIDLIIHTMLSDLPFEIKMGKTKSLLHDNGIVLENGPFIPDSTIYGVSLFKNKQRYIFLSDMGKRECKYIFTLIHELVHIYGKNKLTENEVDKIAFNKIKKVITKESIANKDMHVYLNAFETNEWDSIYEKAKVKINFGKVEDLFVDPR